MLSKMRRMRSFRPVLAYRAVGFGGAMKLDGIDQKIVALLALNCRLTNRALAKSVDLSPSACLERVRKLEASGVILGYRAIVVPGIATERFEGWAVVRFVEPVMSTTEMFVRMIGETPAIIEAHRIAGPYDYALRFLAGHRDAWRDFERRLESLDCHVEARFGVVLEALK